MYFYFDNMRQLHKWAMEHKFKSITDEPSPGFGDSGKDYLCIVARKLDESNCCVEYAVRSWGFNDNFEKVGERVDGAVLYYMRLPSSKSILEKAFEKEREEEIEMAIHVASSRRRSKPYTNPYA